MDYTLLLSQINALTEGVHHVFSNLANVSAALFENLEDINWAGFYIMEGNTLVLGPFQGKTACIEISVGRGVCGNAVLENKTQLVYDVHDYPGHIACDASSNSEIVIPLRYQGKILGVLDIDSPTKGRFTKEDQTGLEIIIRSLEEKIGQELSEYCIWKTLSK